MGERRPEPRGPRSPGPSGPEPWEAVLCPDSRALGGPCGDRPFGGPAVLQAVGRKAGSADGYRSRWPKVVVAPVHVPSGRGGTLPGDGKCPKACRAGVEGQRLQNLSYWARGSEGREQPAVQASGSRSWRRRRGLGLPSLGVQLVGRGWASRGQSGPHLAPPAALSGVDEQRWTEASGQGGEQGLVWVAWDPSTTETWAAPGGGTDRQTWTCAHLLRLLPVCWCHVLPPGQAAGASGRTGLGAGGMDLREGGWGPVQTGPIPAGLWLCPAGEGHMHFLSSLTPGARWVPVGPGSGPEVAAGPARGKGVQRSLGEREPDAASAPLLCASPEGREPGQASLWAPPPRPADAADPGSEPPLIP